MGQIFDTLIRLIPFDLEQPKQYGNTPMVDKRLFCSSANSEVDHVLHAIIYQKNNQRQGFSQQRYRFDYKMK